MLISCQFEYGLIVVATESMTGEINKGDAVLYRRYDGQPIEEGQVIVFERNRTKVIHRVVDIQNIDGALRYYTKGDANEENDAGYVTEPEIIGLTDHKIPLIGYPTVWIRDLFS
jgi:signal peptidase